jgi:hypothetical protein
VLVYKCAFKLICKPLHDQGQHVYTSRPRDRKTHLQRMLICYMYFIRVRAGNDC